MNEAAVVLFPVALLATAIVSAVTAYYAGLNKGYKEGYSDGRRA